MGIETETHRSLEQNRESGNRYRHLQSTDLQKGCQEHTMGKG